ncbi:carboxymethylenebutenolidase [Ktedonobacter sp. SOSP1-52]|uniref:dienelactone hydrolase family protein n=1 Tax=Ktedonobacter sp. SOSP1-52 TaxID=2778366 RepID=UPI001916A44D|nr:dienelactone hydrolase family protein [Ktedonobacter sp. SOSP1-52]GHO62977.1 carboxymethylenebutenolidase [Ktedonobacter sp. SOSP1-52]
MCYDDSARPPLPARATGKAHGEDIVLTAADGNHFAAYFARPEALAKGQVIIYPDVRGLHQFYKELALRFAEIGLPALALDYFGRTAGVTSRQDGFEWMPHIQHMQLKTFFLDVRAALDYLREQGNKGEATFPVGFCIGGAFSFLSGTQQAFELAGVISFYGGLPMVFPEAGAMLDQVKNITCPVLGLFGSADQNIPVETVRTLETRLNARGLENHIIVYEGAPHGFFDQLASEYAAISADAWKQIQNFIATHH